MDIPNLSVNNINQVPQKKSLLPIILIVTILAITNGFWLSRYFPSQKSTSSISNTNSEKNTAVSTDNLKNKDDVQIGKVYGDSGKTFQDTASGTIEKGNINGEGTHILNREGGASQRVSLTSSAVDLDLFVGLKVEVKGQTNTSTKTGWFMDVGSVKRLE
jgi:hypothetical protein